jgi:dTDP-4-amino-4,6-dideoxygalactose transaminase
MDAVMELGHKYGCKVIEDAAQAIGAEYKGRRAAGIAEIGCISFFPSKNLGGFGDGGMLITNQEPLAKKLAALRVHGGTRKYHHDWIGINSRLDALQAAILRVKFRYLDSWTEERRKNAALYSRLLGPASPVKLPELVAYQTRHVYNQYVTRCPERDGLKVYLQEHGVGTEIYYPLPLHLQPCYRHLNYREGDFPVSEHAAKEVLALPIHGALSDEDIEYVCDAIRSFYEKTAGSSQIS